MTIFQPRITNLFLVFFIFVLLFPRIIATTSSSLTCDVSTGHVVPTSPLLTFLERVQDSALKTFGPKDFDPKLYVDLPLKFNLSITEKAFDELARSENGSVSTKDFEVFKDKFFEGAGNDVVYHQPVDYVDEPQGFLSNVENVEVRSWALEIHSLWKNLSRRVSDGVLEHPELHTLLPLPGPFMIPGSRFIEIYYWDSYWVVRGLLVSKMYETAKAIVNNLISFVDKYGFVLNGARSYYTNRSQPPLLSAMVYEIYNRTGDTELAKKALPALLREHHFWNSGQHKVSIEDSQSDNHTLSRYYAMWDKPRPESSTMDRRFASKLSNPSEKQQFYLEVASTAESGWDFSSRWMRNSSDFTTMSTTSILPVDLNVYILRMEIDIAFLAKAIGEESIAVKFSEAAQTRKNAINSVFWNAKMKQWVDYWLPNGTSCKGSHTWQANCQNPSAFASNYIPLWIDLFNSDYNLKSDSSFASCENFNS